MILKESSDQWAFYTVRGTARNEDLCFQIDTIVPNAWDPHASVIIRSLAQSSFKLKNKIGHAHLQVSTDFLDMLLCLWLPKTGKER